jgi:hypothetical protein
LPGWIEESELDFDVFALFCLSLRGIFCFFQMTGVIGQTPPVCHGDAASSFGRRIRL